MTKASATGFHRALISIVLAGGLLFASPAQAQSSGKMPGLLRHGLVVGELVIPDVRIEIYRDQPAEIIYAWPIVWSALRLGFGKSDPCPNKLIRRWKTTWDESACDVEFGICMDCREDRTGYLYLLPFLEAQWVSEVRDVRALGGARTVMGLSKFPLGFSIEGGGLFGTDGNGWFAGGGISRRLERSGLNASVMARRVWVPEAHRWDLTIDLQVPINWPSL